MGKPPLSQRKKRQRCGRKQKKFRENIHMKR